MPPVHQTLASIANALGAELHGPGDVAITGVAGIEAAGPSELTFVANPRYAALARSTRAAAVLVEPGFAVLDRPTLRVADSYLAFARALGLFYQPPAYPPGIHPTAVIDPSAKLGKNLHIAPYVVVEERVSIDDESVLLSHAVVYRGVSIGKRCLIHAHAVIREGCRIGDDCVLGNGVVIGGDGFGFAKQDGRWTKIPQSGPAVLGDRVEVQANACIDRATVGETRIASGTKIDNLVQVGHGSAVGENTLLCAQVGLAGSTTIGRDVILAGQVGVAGHLTVGDGAVATAQTGIPSDVAPGLTVSGYPAMENRAWLRTVAAVNRLPELLRTLRKRDG